MIPRCSVSKHEKAIMRELQRFNHEGHLKEYAIVICKDDVCETVIGEGHEIPPGRLPPRLEDANLYHNHPARANAMLSIGDVGAALQRGMRKICAVSDSDYMCALPKRAFTTYGAVDWYYKTMPRILECEGLFAASKQRCVADLFGDIAKVCTGRVHEL